MPDPTPRKLSTGHAQQPPPDDADFSADIYGDPQHNDDMAARKDMLRTRLREMYPPGSHLGDDAVSVGVRDTPDGVVVLTRLTNEDRLYGVPVSVKDTSHEFYYTRFPATDDEEWLDSVGIGMGVLFGTGFRHCARRTLVGDYIELDPSDGWPIDSRFYLQAPDVDDELSDPTEALKAVGLATTSVAQARAEGRLLVWVQAYENNSTGIPLVGHAVVEWDSEDNDRSVATLSHLETTDGVPVIVLVDLAHLAAHLAGAAGASTVVTTNPLPELDVLGFKPAGSTISGERAVDTSFLDADPDGAARLLAASLVEGSSWGSNRDAAGRHIPQSRSRSWWHRITHPRTGRPPRRYVG